MTIPNLGMPQAFTASEIEKAPDARGVYALLANDGRVIFLGRAFGGIVFGTIRQELGKHLAGSSDACPQVATHYTCEVCDQPEAALARHLEEYKIHHEGKLPPCNKPSDEDLLRGS